MTPRRRFLQILASGFVGLSLVDVEWIPTPMQSSRPVPTGLLHGLEDLTTALARDIGRLIGPGRVFQPADYAIGVGGMTSQYHIGASITDEAWAHGLCVEEYVEPMAHLFAQEIQDREIRRFGALHLPRDLEDGVVVTDTVSGATVRGLRAWSMGDESQPPHMMTRFDILGG